jgi:hypothetical protein
MFPVSQKSALKLLGYHPNNKAHKAKPSIGLGSLFNLQSDPGIGNGGKTVVSTGDNQMKRLVLTFLSTAAVCAVLSATPAAAQETVTGAPRGETPVTVEGYGNSSGYTGPSAPAMGAAMSGPAFVFAPVKRCHVDRDFYGSQGRYTVVCGP